MAWFPSCWADVKSNYVAVVYQQDRVSVLHFTVNIQFFSLLWFIGITAPGTMKATSQKGNF